MLGFGHCEGFGDYALLGLLGWARCRGGRVVCVELYLRARAMAADLTNVVQYTGIVEPAVLELDVATNVRGILSGHPLELTPLWVWYVNH
jgi:hypothetical protein